jgi:hypothetical protein
MVHDGSNSCKYAVQQQVYVVTVWDNVFGNNNVNVMFNNFHNMYLRCF